MSSSEILVFEWLATILSLVGAFLLATNTSISKFGWWAFLVANFAWAVFAICIGRHGMLVQQIGFMGTSLLGLYRSFLVPSSAGVNESRLKALEAENRQLKIAAGLCS
jgi:hypothetical protein